ncbi:MAG: hypothetical protein ABFQ65_00635, partial [Nanoarchaeota archaeon]
MTRRKVKITDCIQSDLINLIAFAIDNLPFELMTIIEMFQLAFDKLNKEEDLSRFYTFYEEIKDKSIDIYESGILFTNDMKNLISYIIEANQFDHGMDILQVLKINNAVALAIPKVFDIEKKD